MGNEIKPVSSPSTPPEVPMPGRRQDTQQSIQSDIAGIFVARAAGFAVTPPPLFGGPAALAGHAMINGLQAKNYGQMAKTVIDARNGN